MRLNMTVPRRQVSHKNLWRAVSTSPLTLFYVVIPFFFGIAVSPLLLNETGPVPWLGMFTTLTSVSLLIYLNGLFAAFFLGVPLFYFLNAVRFQLRWVYLLGGFAGGTIVNFLYPWYTRFLRDGEPYPAVVSSPLAKIAVSTYPILFGCCGLLVAHSFWKTLVTDKTIDREH